MKRLVPIFALCAVALMMVGAAGKQFAPAGTGSISGIVTDSVTGLPIEGAKVMAGCGRMATTGSDGSYTIANLAAGDYTVKASKCNTYVMKQYPTPVHVDEGQAVNGIDFALAPMGGGGGNGSISGTVYDKATNAPIAGAKVTAGGCRNSATTGSDGIYTITGLADGSYTVRAMKTGYKCATYPSPVVISGGQAVTGIDFHLISSNIRALD
jgi:uncharacterized surface anchored protein